MHTDEQVSAGCAVRIRRLAESLELRPSQAPYTKHIASRSLMSWSRLRSEWSSSQHSYTPLNALFVVAHCEPDMLVEGFLGRVCT